MSDIPPEIARDILLRLPAVSLLRFRAVCKSWKNIIDDPSFIRSHANEQRSSTTLLLRNSDGALFTFSWDSLTYEDDSCQTFDVTPIRKFICNRALVSSSRFATAPCNGLFLLLPHNRGQTDWLIENPLTRDFHLLPPVEPEFHSSFYGFGLGYDYAADDYKVVRIDKLHSVTLVYSLKQDSWKKIKNFPGDDLVRRAGIYLKGTLYWRVWDCIIALDLASEDYRRLPLPPTRNVYFCPSLEVIGGFLACSDSPRWGDLYVWVMKETGVWTELFSFKEQFGSNIMGPLGVRIIAYWESKGKILIQDRKGWFLWCDIVNQTVKKVTVSGIVSPDFCAELWSGSLFRLDRNVDGVAVVRVKRKRNSYSSRLEVSMTVSDVKLHLDSESSNGC